MTEAPNFFARRIIGKTEEFAKGEHPFQKPDDHFSVQLALGAREILAGAERDDVERILGLACVIMEIERLGLRDKMNPDFSPEGIAGLVKHYLEQQAPLDIGNGVMIRGNKKDLEKLEFLKPQL